jgi:hypothetical protein
MGVFGTAPGMLPAVLSHGKIGLRPENKAKKGASVDRENAVNRSHVLGYNFVASTKTRYSSSSSLTVKTR